MVGLCENERSSIVIAISLSIIIRQEDDKGGSKKIVDEARTDHRYLSERTSQETKTKNTGEVREK